MASVKYKGRWVESSSLPIEVLLELGLDKEAADKVKKMPEEKKTAVEKKDKDLKKTKKKKGE